LLRSIAGSRRVFAEDPSLEEIAHLCGLLPLALRMAAALLRHRPCWSLADLAARLREARPSLAGFRNGNRDLAAVFDLSYAALSNDQQSLFRRLGLHPDPDIDPYAAAALVDAAPDTADTLLQNLVDHNLLTESPPGRYRIHDLIFTHVRTVAATDAEPEREAALSRLLDYYQHSALRANALVASVPWPELRATAPRHARTLLDQHTAQAWLRAERANLDAAFDHARRQGPTPRVVALAAGLAQIMLTHGPGTRALDVHEAGAQAAARLGDRLGQALALAGLGGVRFLAGDHPGADTALADASQLYRDLGYRHSQALALAELGAVRQLTGDYKGADDALTEASQLYRDLGYRHGQARILAELGIVRRLAGDDSAAIDALTEALMLYRDVGDRRGWADVLTNLGLARQETGDLPGAPATR
jgi:tetratricopeptide (TPR) repeat protein